MIALDPARHAVIVERLLASPVAARLGLVLDAMQSGSVRIVMPFDPANVTEKSMVHGGIIATLADVAAVAGAVSNARDVPSVGATTNLSISYLAPADGCKLIATAHVLRAGGRNHVVRVEVTDSAEQPVAEALVTVMLA